MQQMHTHKAVTGRDEAKKLLQGISKQGKGLQHFYSDIALSAAILYFRTLCALLRSRSTPRT